MPEGLWNFTLGPLVFSFYSRYHLCSSMALRVAAAPNSYLELHFHLVLQSLYLINQIQMPPSLWLLCRHWYLLRFPGGEWEGKNNTEKEKLNCRWGESRGLGDHVSNRGGGLENSFHLKQLLAKIHLGELLEDIIATGGRSLSSSRVIQVTPHTSAVTQYGVATNIHYLHSFTFKVYILWFIVYLLFIPF